MFTALRNTYNLLAIYLADSLTFSLKCESMFTFVTMFDIDFSGKSIRGRCTDCWENTGYETSNKESC